MNLGNTAPQRTLMVHFRYHVGQEQQLAITGAGHQRIFGIIGMIDLEAGVAHAILAPHIFQVFFPALTVGGIGKHKIELFGGESIMSQGGPLGSTDYVIGVLPFTLHQHIGLADRVCLRVYLLSEQVGLDLLTLGSSQLQ